MALPEDFDKLTAELKTKYPNANVQKIEFGDGPGRVSVTLQPQTAVSNQLKFLRDKGSVLIHPRQGQAKTAADYQARVAEFGSTVSRPQITRSDLDLIVFKGGLKSSPWEIYSKSIEHYYTKDIYGSVITLLADFSNDGFMFDIDKHDIENFYKNWAWTVNLTKLLDQIFLDFFRVGLVVVYRTFGVYRSTITPFDPGAGEKKTGREFGAKPAKLSRDNMPTSYTILNPTRIRIEGSLLFDSQVITLEPDEALRDLVNKSSSGSKGSKGSGLSDEDKRLLKLLPPAFIADIKANKNIRLDPMNVFKIGYRQMPYERYPYPRGLRAYDCLDFKNALRQADLSTLDGITNYILKITIGSDEFPVTDQTALETVAELFNTTSKAFDVVWDHTLKVEKITFPEAADILGARKYEQVDADLTGALGVVRALIDGGGNLSQASAQLAVKTVIQEINYARREVSNWLYREITDVARAMKFKKIPQIRWNRLSLRDEEVAYNVIAGLIDRRIISYQTGLEFLGYDYTNTLKELREEQPDVQAGVLGIIGSPYNSKAAPPATPTPSQVQPKQRTPVGTPSEGRPKGQVNPGRTKQTKKVNFGEYEELDDLLESMSDEEFELTMAKMVERRRFSKKVELM